MTRFAILLAALLLTSSTQAQNFSGAQFAAGDQPLVAQPPPATAPAQINPVGDRDYLLSVIAERDRQYNQRFDAQEKAVSSALTAAKEAVAAALTAAKEAVIKAEAASEKRFDAVNEFRKTLSDQTQTFIPRAEYAGQTKQIQDLLSKMVPREEHETRWKLQSEAVATLANRIESVSNRQSISTGQSEGQSGSWAVMLGASTMLVGVGMLLVNFMHRPSRSR